MNIFLEERRQNQRKLSNKGKKLEDLGAEVLTPILGDAAKNSKHDYSDSFKLPYQLMPEKLFDYKGYPQRKAQEEKARLDAAIFGTQGEKGYGSANPFSAGYASTSMGDDRKSVNEYVSAQQKVMRANAEKLGSGFEARKKGTGLGSGFRSRKDGTGLGSGFRSRAKNGKGFQSAKMDSSFGDSSISPTNSEKKNKSQVELTVTVEALQGTKAKVEEPRNRDGLLNTKINTFGTNLPPAG
jgi:hypothetical protein